MRKHVARVLSVVVLVVLAFSFWATMPPPQQAPAQDWYGPQVTSDLKRFNVDCTTLGNNTIIAAKANTKFRIISITVTSCSTTADTFYLVNGDNNLWYSSTIPMPIDASGISGPAGISLSAHNGGLFQTDTVNEAVVLVLSVGENCNVTGTYVECF